MEVGDIVQVNPEYENKAFAGCFLMVEEIKNWGIMGFVNVPQKREELPARAYIRIPFDQVEYIGKASWVPTDVLKNEL